MYFCISTLICTFWKHVVVCVCADCLSVLQPPVWARQWRESQAESGTLTYQCSATAVLQTPSSNSLQSVFVCVTGGTDLYLAKDKISPDRKNKQKAAVPKMLMNCHSYFNFNHLYSKEDSLSRRALSVREYLDRTRTPGFSLSSGCQWLYHNHYFPCSSPKH